MNKNVNRINAGLSSVGVMLMSFYIGLGFEQKNPVEAFAYLFFAYNLIIFLISMIDLYVGHIMDAIEVIQNSNDS